MRGLQSAVFLALVFAVSLAFGWMVLDFLFPVFWAAVLAVIFQKPYQRFQRLLRGRAPWAAVLTIAVVLMVVVLPITLVGIGVTREAAGLYDRISRGDIDLQALLDKVVGKLPTIERLLERFGIDVERIRQGIAGAAVTATQFLASRALAAGQNAARLLASFFIMLYLLFFFLRDGKSLLDLLVRALPLGDVRERRLFERFANVTRATLKGTVIVSMVQGALGAIVFLVLGIPAAIIWGVLMAIASFLPAVGPALIWLPAAIILMATGHLVKGIILVVVGVGLIGLVDNVLRPLLVGRDTRIPDWVILISTLGGLAVFGISGFVIGPIIAALFLTIWEMFIEEFGRLDDASRA